MFSADKRLRPRDEEVAAKVMDGEAIIINLANGTYYSMDNAGAFVWELLQARRSVSEMVDALAARYEVARDEAQRDVESLLSQLVRESLIDVTDDESAAEDVAASSSARLPYERPNLNVYRDMGDLLALDPPTPGLDSPWKDSDQATP